MIEWHTFHDRPEHNGFFLALYQLEGSDKYFFDIAGFKEGKWKFRAFKIAPVDINDLDHDWTGVTLKFKGWRELPDLESAIAQCSEE